MKTVNSWMNLGVIVLALLVASAQNAGAGGGPENVAIVVNGNSWASRAIANEYVALRGIPSINVVTLEQVPDLQSTDINTFRSAILLPVLQALEQRGVAPQIDYLVYSSDLPTAIDLKPDLGERNLPRFLTPVGSCTGLTYLYRYTLSKNPSYLNLQGNRYARVPLEDVAPRLLSGEELEKYSEVREHLREKDFQQAADLLKPIVEAHPRIAPMQYNLACCLARLDEPDEALVHLTKAVEAGWRDAKVTAQDEDLTSLVDMPEFQDLLAKMKDQPVQIQPSLAFRSSTAWSVAGEPGENPADDRYLLSAVLGVTTGRGNSVPEVLEYLHRSAAADGTKPGGTIYYCKSGDVARSGPREPLFDSAVKELERLGVRAEIVEGALPKSKQDVQGLMTGVANFNWSQSGSTIRPGAFCDSLTSYAGVLTEGAGQTPLTEFLRHGASGSTGTVTEPFNLPNKFPSPFLHVHYAEGCSLAEAFYQSLQGPYQQLLVADPLCQPWARVPELAIPAYLAGQEVSGAITLEATVAGRPADEIGRLELFLDGRRMGVAGPKQKFRIDTSEHPDGWHEIRIVAVAKDSIATQGGAVLPLVFRNHNQVLNVNRPQDNKVWRWDERYPVAMELDGAERLMLVHHDRVVANMPGGEGEASLQLANLGPGPVTLQPLALLPGTPPVRVFGESFTIDVVAPNPLPAVDHREPGLWKPGLLATPDDGNEPRVIASLKPGDWLSKLGWNEGTTFTVSGRFRVASTDVYQFQWQSPESVRIEIDGQLLDESTTPRWHLAPIALGEGMHEVTIHSRVSENPKLQVRFGLAGTKSLAGDDFVYRDE
jgi:tetratricopeptide (TPR) repeat protein